MIAQKQSPPPHEIKSMLAKLPDGSFCSIIFVDGQSIVASVPVRTAQEAIAMAKQKLDGCMEMFKEKHPDVRLLHIEHDLPENFSKGGVS